MSERRPSFQFYTGDWLSSRKIAMMTPAQEGAYIRLLCYCWDSEDCSIPNDDKVLAQLSRLGDEWDKGGGRVVKGCFNQHPTTPTKLVHKRLLEERRKQDAWREKSAEGGRKSRRTGKLKQSKGGARVVQPKGNSSSPSSSSTSSPKDPPPLPPQRGERDGNWLTPYFDLVKEICGGRPNAGRLAKALRPLHDEYEEPMTMAALRNYLANTPARYRRIEHFAENFLAYARVDGSNGKPKGKMGFLRDEWAKIAQKDRASREIAQEDVE